MHPVQGCGRQSKLRQQKIRQKLRTPGGHLQPYRLPIVPVLQALAKGCPQVAHILFVQCQIGMARHAELREFRDLPPREKILQMRANNAGEAHEKSLPRRHAGGHADQPWQRTRHLDDGNLVLPAESVVALQANNEVQRFVGHLWKRMGRIQPHWNQQWPDLVHKIVVDPALLGG
ncbi:hypothetical protein D3C71_1102800 [compost metagenome]